MKRDDWEGLLVGLLGNLLGVAVVGVILAIIYS